MCHKIDMNIENSIIYLYRTLYFIKIGFIFLNNVVIVLE